MAALPVRSTPQTPQFGESRDGGRNNVGPLEYRRRQMGCLVCARFGALDTGGSGGSGATEEEMKFSIGAHNTSGSHQGHGCEGICGVDDGRCGGGR